ncbi:MAG: U32 family peptidase [Methylacidiphilales bacterium]|nr:U32 family peptidase [Candidatus Methylacidiphilales bacterium]
MGKTIEKQRPDAYLAGTSKTKEQPASTRKPELLAPAGDWECARAAVANGADAVYFGLPAFNARMRATNFTPDDLPKLMAFLHGHGVKGYVAFNVLIFTDELAAAEEELVLLESAGVDAAIVQDLGLASLARERAPGLAIHASTQMTLTSPEGVAFAHRLGISRAVLARELSLRELAKFKDRRSEIDGYLPLEVFVHGALCVAYSGQCLTSEALGRRSANRGECAQACRLPYEMIVDGVKRDLGDRRYLLSPQDLAAVEEIPELVRLGIVSFKIEGRLKTPEYVAAVTQVYRRAIDSAAAAISDRRPLSESSTTSDDRYKLEMAFSRGLYPGWMHGVNHQELVHARYGKKRGVFIGAVTAVGRNYIEVKPGETPVRPGDGVVIDQGADTDREQGGRIYQATPQRDGVVRLGFEHGKINFDAVKAGDRIWKTDDPQLNRELRKSWSGELPKPKRALEIIVIGRAGGPLRIEGRCEDHVSIVESEIPLQVAQKRPLADETLRAQLGRLGDTGLEMASLDNRLEGDVILPVSELNRLRRELVEQLQNGFKKAIRHPEPVEGSVPSSVVRSRLDALSLQRDSSPKIEKPVLTVLCRSLDQIAAALRLGVTEIYADFEDIRRYKDAVETVRQRGYRADAAPAQILLATPRIQKAGEQGFFKLIENAGPDGVLIRNLGALDYFGSRRSPGDGPPLRCIGDFSLNVANPLTAELLMAEKLERLTVSYDLNAGQVLDLLRAAPPGWFEITLHQHIPMFHMEHCVFAAFLSDGTDYTNCGRPCDTHRVELRDRVGVNHPLKADVGCRNTLFHAQAQSGAAFFDAFRKLNPAAFRVELLLEDAAETERILRGYQRLLAGSSTGPMIIRELNLRSQLGVTTGTLAI